MLLPGAAGTLVYAGLFTPESGVIYALFLAPTLAFINAVIGMFLIRKGVRSSQSTFFKMVFGGMGVRLLVLGGIIALIYNFRLLHFLTFLVALLAYYVAFMLVEILYVHIQMSGAVNIQRADSEDKDVNAK